MGNPKLLNARVAMETTVRLIDSLLDEHKKARTGGTILAPMFVEELPRHRFLIQAILRHHASKKTRKDIYVPRG